MTVQTRLRGFAAFFAALLTTGLAACGSSASVSNSVSVGGGGGGTAAGGGQTTGGANDACAFIDSATAMAILGTSVGQGKVTAGVPYPNCLVPAADTTRFANVSVTVFHGAIAAQGVITGAAQFKATTALDGVGDQAFRDDAGDIVVAKKGDIGCTVLAIHAAITSPDALATALAAICLKAFAAG